MLLTDENKIIRLKHTIWVVPDSNGYSMERLVVFSSFRCIVCKFCTYGALNLLPKFYGFSAISTCYEGPEGGYKSHLPAQILPKSHFQA